jgi:hypothetical protein
VTDIPATRGLRGDVVIGVSLFAIAATICWLASGALDTRLLHAGTMDLWFEGDVPRVFDDITNRWADHYRSQVHPLFGAIAFPAVFFFDRVVGLDTWVAVRVVTSVVSGLWLSALFVTLRLILGKQLDALIFTVVGGLAAGAVFWMPVPETHPFGALTILGAVLLVASTAYRRVPEWVDVVVSASTLSVTVTNWMAGIAATVVRRRPLRAAQITANALVLVVVLWTAQKRLIPGSRFFLGNATDSGQVLSAETRGPLAVARSFFMHTIVLPAVQVVDRPSSGDWPIMILQPSRLGSGGTLGLLATALWGVLLLGGIAALLRSDVPARLRAFLALTIGGHWVLFTLFGTETFIYAPVLVSLLIPLGSLAAIGKRRTPALIVAGLLASTLAVHHASQWRHATAFFQEFQAYEHNPVAARAGWRDGPWPAERRPAEVEILEGVRLFDNAKRDRYGNFSPAIGEFSLSIWELGDDGRPLRRTEARPDGEAPDASTDFFRAAWNRVGARHWALELEPVASSIALVVRSVGLATGPIRSLEWNAGELRINGRWRLAVNDPTRVAVQLVNEEDRSWPWARPDRDRLDVQSGWAAARIEVSGSGPISFLLEDEQASGPVDRAVAILGRGIRP